MATIKTAISMQETLFARIEAVAQQLSLSRSQLVALAVEAFIERYDNQQLLHDLNQAYADDQHDELARARASMGRIKPEDVW